MHAARRCPQPGGHRAQRSSIRNMLMLHAQACRARDQTALMAPHLPWCHWGSMNHNAMTDIPLSGSGRWFLVFAQEASQITLSSSSECASAAASAAARRLLAPLLRRPSPLAAAHSLSGR